MWSGHSNLDLDEGALPYLPARRGLPLILGVLSLGFGAELVDHLVWVIRIQIEGPVGENV